MDNEVEFDKLYGNLFILKESKPDICPYAQKFIQWTEKLLSENESFDVIGINQAKLKLLDKYFDWFQSVSNVHRFRASPRGHTCIYHVFAQTYIKLRQIELSLNPKALYSEGSFPPQIAGIFIGEKE